MATINAFSNPAFLNADFGVKPTSFSSSYSLPSATSAAPTGMDPLSAFLGIGSIATSIGGLFGQTSAAEQQARATKEVAEISAQSTQKAAEAAGAAQLAGKLGGFGLDLLASKWNTRTGAARQRGAGLESAAQEARFQAQNPDLATMRSVKRYEDQLARAMPGYTPPSSLFI